MPSFKPKTNKKIKYNKQSAITLDTKHKEFLNEFSKDENDRIPNLKLERQELKQQLLKDLTIEQQLEIEDKIHEISEQIKEIKSRKKDYFLDIIYYLSRKIDGNILLNSTITDIEYYIDKMNIENSENEIPSLA